MDDEGLQTTIEELAKTLPKFPDGRIDYTNAPVIYGVSIVVGYQGKILFLKRASDLHFYPDLWNVASGFIDQPIPLKDLTLKELREETAITEDQIANVAFANPRLVKDPLLDKTWHIYPALVELKAEPAVTINWEHTEYKWLRPEEVVHYDRMPALQ